MGRSNMILLDSHALVWWTLQPERLSEKSQELAKTFLKEDALISAISFWELGVKIAGG